MLLLRQQWLLLLFAIFAVQHSQCFLKKLISLDDDSTPVESDEHYTLKLPKLKLWKPFSLFEKKKEKLEKKAEKIEEKIEKELDKIAEKKAKLDDEIMFKAKEVLDLFKEEKQDNCDYENKCKKLEKAIAKAELKPVVKKIKKKKPLYGAPPPPPPPSYAPAPPPPPSYAPAPPPPPSYAPAPAPLPPLKYASDSIEDESGSESEELVPPLYPPPPLPPDCDDSYYSVYAPPPPPPPPPPPLPPCLPVNPYGYHGYSLT